LIGAYTTLFFHAANLKTRTMKTPAPAPVSSYEPRDLRCKFCEKKNKQNRTGLPESAISHC
jgi:hypothetical protein